MVATNRIVTILILIGYMSVLAESAVRCKPGDKKTTITIGVEFRQMPLKRSYNNVKIITSNKRFQSSYSEYARAREKYNSEDNSDEVDVGYGPFSTSVLVSYASVTQSANSMSRAQGSTTSTETYSERENTEEREYFDGYFQIMRDITTTVTIDGVIASVEEQQIVNARSTSNPMTYDELRRLAQDYISDIYGTGEQLQGKISGGGTIFSQSQCYKTSGPKIPAGWKPTEKDVMIPFDLEAVPLYIKTDSVMGSNDQVRVYFYTIRQDNFADIYLKFSNPPQYKLWKCNDWLQFPVSLPPEQNKVWKIRKTAGPRIVVTCNDKEVLNFLISSSTCTKTTWNHWSDDVAFIHFPDSDGASDSYIPGTCS